MPLDIPTHLGRVRAFFNLSHQLDNQQAVLESVREGVNFRGANSWILIFAIFTACLGLNVNSTAVIIGAMLISPLMGPIIGIGFAVGINDFELLKHSYRNLAAATAISMLTAMCYFLITPIDEAQSELLARTSPTLYDVLIALFGGAAGIVALSMKGRGGNVIPGVAIATALMPPLCTAGYGLAMGNWSYFLGAFYLFFINTVFICLATFIGVRLMKFSYKAQLEPGRFRQVRRYIWAIVVLTMAPSLYLTVGIVRDSFSQRNVNRFVQAELHQRGTEILSTELDRSAGVLSVVAVGREIKDSLRLAAAARLGEYDLAGYSLHLIQGTEGDSLLASRLSSSRGLSERQLADQNAQILSLEASL
ncbi:MAG: DUF389 domain-containing protein, partial [Bacteroidaceae bacterium]|nr:DUF389 domain-containing protein [Bacteroidaceae bacterium]